MWWGLAIGVLAIGVLSHVSRELVVGLLGRGVVRAIGLGLLFDLCNHGILMVGAKLYERGATLGQTLAFLIASPWNSLSLTLVLIGLIGLKLALAFIVLSALVAMVAGTVADSLVGKGLLPGNPNTPDPGAGPGLGTMLAEHWRKIRWRPSTFRSVLGAGLSGSVPIVRWLLLGVLVAALLQVLVPDELFAKWFGATLVGLALTMVATTVIEVCTEGSSPIAADLVNRAGAPGNGFVFLMGGVATDYTELMVLRETTKSWKATLFLPLVTIPQVLVIGALLNAFASP